MYEDGLTMRNGFFRTRHFNRNGSEAGSLDLFADDHPSDGEGGGVGVDTQKVGLNSQAEAKRRKDRLEREEFIRKFRVCLTLSTCTCVYLCMVKRPCVCVCVCMCVHAPVHVRVCACVCVCFVAH